MGGIAYVRVNNTEQFVPRRFGPKDERHPSIGDPCPACGIQFDAGDFTTLVPLGPGDEEEAREKARKGRWYNAIALEVHYACVTGSEDDMGP